MNRGHTLSCQNNAESLRAAIDAYSEAIGILDSLTEKTTAQSNSLGAALMNRGQLRHQLLGTEESHLALADFEQAATILTTALDETSPWPRRNLIGTLLNHANLLLDLGRFPEAKDKAEAALDKNPFAHELDPTDCELTVLGTRAFCDAVGQLLPSLPEAEQTSLSKHASERLNQGLAIIRKLRPHLDNEPFAEASKRLFRFGCLLHATENPRLLKTFILTHLKGTKDQSIRHHFYDTSKQSIQLAIESISNSLLTPHTSQEEQDILSLTAQTLGALYSKL